MSKRQRKNLIRIILAAITFALSFLSGENQILRGILLFTAYILVGGDVIFSAVRKIFSGQIFDEELLMSLATVGAIALKEFHEAVMVMLLYQVGELFQSIAVGKSRKSIKSLMKIKPEFARLLRDGEEIKLPPDEATVGDIVLVLPGEKVPLDGVIEEGETSFDCSSLTGESVPVGGMSGDKAIAGTINLDSPVKVCVTSLYSQSTVAKILQLVEESSLNKSEPEKFITKFSRRYTPCVFAAAILTALLPPLVFKAPFGIWVERALLFLIVSCPCALVISVPLTFFGGIGAASKKGILIKGSSYLEILSKVKSIAFDKTGTLTEGGFSVVKTEPHNISEEELIETAALAESYSIHPIALSILEQYGKEVDKTRIDDITSVSGCGIIAKIDGETVCAGNKKLFLDNGITVDSTEENATVVYVAKGGKYLGSITLEDEVKPDARKMLNRLRDMGINRTVMLTGDNPAAAEKAAQSIGIGEVYAKLLPEEKVEKAIKIKETTSGKVAFVGDGINDAPVISCVDVGIAMGALGSEAAIEAADIVIMNDSLDALCDAIQLSKKTMRIAKQNICVSLAVKIGVMVLGLMGLTNMYGAIFADVGVMVLAVLNAMRNLYTEKAVVA